MIEVRRRFAAPPEQVFDAWTLPEVLTEWWSARRARRVEPGHPVCMVAPMTRTSFVGIWSAMTAAMMLPSALPALVRRRGRCAAVAAVEYLAVWIAVGLIPTASTASCAAQG